MSAQDAQYHIDLETSRRLSEGSIPTACYRNTIMAGAAIDLDPELNRKAIWYVEGFIVTNGIPITHGWMEVGTSEQNAIVTILDPTLPLSSRDNEELQAIPYFPGHRWPLRLALELAIHGEILPFFEKDHSKMVQGEEFMAAKRAAYAFVGKKPPEDDEAFL